MVKHGRLTLHFYSKVTPGMHVIGIFSGKRILLPAFKSLLAQCSAPIEEKTSKTCTTQEYGGFERLDWMITWCDLALSWRDRIRTAVYRM